MTNEQDRPKTTMPTTPANRARKTIGTLCSRFIGTKTLASTVALMLLQTGAFAQTSNNLKVSNLTGQADGRVLYEGIPICHSFDCSVRDIVSMSEKEWHEVIGWFSPPATRAHEEREQIRQAIGWLEVIVGRYTPTQDDIAGNLRSDVDKAGQLDCIDESRNSTTYLRLLERAGVLRFHVVVERAYRRAIFDQHWSAQIEEIETGNRYVVDSWFQDNGFLPHVEQSEVWKDISFFSSAYSSTVSDSLPPADSPADYGSDTGDAAGVDSSTRNN